MPRLTAEQLARFRADYHQCGVTIVPLLDEVEALTAERDAARLAQGLANAAAREALAQLDEVRADVARLQGIVESLAARVCAKSELLSKRAEKAPEGGG